MSKKNGTAAQQAGSRNPPVERIMHDLKVGNAPNIMKQSLQMTLETQKTQIRTLESESAEQPRSVLSHSVCPSISTGPAQTTMLSDIDRGMRSSHFVPPQRDHFRWSMARQPLLGCTRTSYSCRFCMIQGITSA